MCTRRRTGRRTRQQIGEYTRRHAGWHARRRTGRRTGRRNRIIRGARQHLLRGVDAWREPGGKHMRRQKSCLRSLCKSGEELGRGRHRRHHSGGKGARKREARHPDIGELMRVHVVCAIAV